MRRVLYLSIVGSNGNITGRLIDLTCSIDSISFGDLAIKILYILINKIFYIAVNNIKIIPLKVY